MILAGNLLFFFACVAFLAAFAVLFEGARRSSAPLAAALAFAACCAIALIFSALSFIAYSGAAAAALRAC